MSSIIEPIIEWPKPRGYNPHEMLYPDRRMLKWQGLILSDHTEAMLAEQAAESLRREPVEFDEQELVIWDERLQESITNEQPVQLTIDQPGMPLHLAIGTVLKADRKGICLMTESGQEIYPLDCVINVESLD